MSDHVVIDHDPDTSSPRREDRKLEIHNWDRAKGLALTRMLWWATHDAQQYNNSLAYATVPPEITQKSEAFIKQISVGGQPIFPGQ